MKNPASKQSQSREDRIVVANDEPADNAVYAEYVRGFDDIPVLQDAVRIPPARAPQPDFRRGERRDARREQRPDAYSAREANAAEIELLYQEYSRPPPAAVRPKRKKAQKRKSRKR